jgi:hypothetical protein
MPNLILLTSGASLAEADPAHPRGNEPSIAPAAEQPARERQKLLRLIDWFIRIPPSSRGHANVTSDTFQPQNCNDEGNSFSSTCHGWLPFCSSPNGPAGGEKKPAAGFNQTQSQHIEVWPRSTSL